MRAVSGHIRAFAEMMHQRAGRSLNAWIQTVRQDPLPEPHSFAAGIEHDFDAVLAALTLPYNAAVVEGHVNRIKTLKRQMYGRASFQLLRARVLHTP